MWKDANLHKILVPTEQRGLKAISPQSPLITYFSKRDEKCDKQLTIKSSSQ